MVDSPFQKHNILSNKQQTNLATLPHNSSTCSVMESKSSTRQNLNNLDYPAMPLRSTSPCSANPFAPSTLSMSQSAHPSTSLT